MKIIGLIGGMSWESSVSYYRIINEEVKERLGGLHSAKCILYSVDFEEIEVLQRNDQWDKAGTILAEAAQSLEGAGAEVILICTNTMHKVAEQVENNISIPLLHIADITADRIQRNKIQTVGLLGTKYTMEQDFYKLRLETRGIKVLIPDNKDKEVVNRVIYQELCLGKINQDSKEAFKRIIKMLVERGAEGVILGCTEIGLLIGEEDVSVRIFDTALIHAKGAVDYALENECKEKQS
ncbi:aspartate racemase [Desulfosporosinus orientis DSM 765]|uniref:Aspartate racemase n=1 Tax=Desulfosporosinus orientis (strain ATCC 19365 / DSM 765 / NCIMB 8382 / VKM B-1628 / Singapore I) TaxID=768706 RepID=G7WIM1_DESOD|nr:aspartate/glutamate racemase family protein [Desulfosporosinus orientis]AET69095.1 aspartate racemase [Desulfosporosinus orientis DSM 765]